MYEDQTQDFLKDIKNRLNLLKCQYDSDEITSDSADEGQDTQGQACGFCHGCIEGVKERGVPECDELLTARVESKKDPAKSAAAPVSQFSSRTEVAILQLPINAANDVKTRHFRSALDYECDCCGETWSSNSGLTGFSYRSKVANLARDNRLDQFSLELSVVTHNEKCKSCGAQATSFYQPFERVRLVIKFVSRLLESDWYTNK